MRHCAPLLLIVLLSVPAPRAGAGCRPPAGALELFAEQPGGSAIAVDGIVCDNLRDTSPADRDRLVVRLAGRVQAQIVDAMVHSPDASAADAEERGSVGAAIIENGRLFYYPPDEFNRRQRPRTLRDVDGPASRCVLLTAHVRFADGAVRTVGPVRIVLGRAPVVMIHGINRGPDCWTPMIRAFAGMRGRGGALEIPCCTVDHFAPLDYEGVNFRDRQRYPDYLSYGCGPVEIGAALLARRIDEVRRQVLAGEPLPALDFGRASAAPRPFAYRFPGATGSEPPRLAIRRVDLLGWSYGGIIGRWYIAGLPRGPALDYMGGYVLRGADGRPLDLQPVVPYRGDVRKLITLGSMWRGVPLVNCLNEIRFSAPDDPRSLARAPIRVPSWMPRAFWNQIGADRDLGSFIHAIDPIIRLRTPAMEVMAIDSPWMDALIYGAPHPGLDAPATPFREGVAYGSVGGDSSAYLTYGPASSISPYGVFAYFQRPSRFPYLALERRSGLTRALSPIVGDEGDYTDGVVPLWSSLIPGGLPGAAQIVPTAHDTYFNDRDTLRYTAVWLNNAELPMGRALNGLWDSRLSSRRDRKRWVFRRGQMAPVGHEGVYGRVGGIGRVLAPALFPGRSLVVKRIGPASVSVEWSAPAGGRLWSVSLYAAVGADAKPGRGRRAIRVARPAKGSEPPYVLLEGLRPGAAYEIVAQALSPNPPDAPVIVKSEPVPVP
ncbi:MAG TPA: hypothetical protein VKT77_20690 [Chthonomonadaceae bacterium]|nr:hypothetical protein [Chthonomonadaceae bacterium]